jgi:AAA15 family ATPase/GTPase
MLLEFKKSEEQCFAMVAGEEDNSHPNNFVTLDFLPEHNNRVLKTSVIYGANDSGKTQFLRDILNFKKIMTDKKYIQPEAGTSIECEVASDNKLVTQRYTNSGVKQRLYTSSKTNWFNKIGVHLDTTLIGRARLNKVSEFMKSYKVLVVDNLDLGVHPNLLYNFIKNVHSQNDCQLIFTAHNQVLIDLNLMRRDQIWFMERNKKTNKSSLFSLDQFQHRDVDLQMWFVEGRFCHVD